jgi:hypothetical protein
MYLPWYAAAMKVDKMSISLEAELGDQVRASAHRSGRGLSSWLAAAAAAQLRVEALAGFLDDWEAEHGELTADEVAHAEIELGLRSAGPRA